MRTLGIATLALALGAAGCNNPSSTGPVAVNDTGRPAKQIAPGMANKAVRGVVNLITGVVEWPMQTYKGWKDGVGFIENKPFSRTVGTLKGLIFSGPGYWVGRSGSGAMELFTFWAANRPNNEKIGVPLDDEYAWEMGKPYSIFEPTFGQGIEPYGWKFGHGVTDGFLGIVELPGQIVKGSRDGNIPKGIGKGFWYAFSRSATGFGEAVLFLFPNPKDTCGRAWDGEWPWSAFEAKK